MESNKKNLDAYYRIGLSEEEKEKYYAICENTEISYENTRTYNKNSVFDRLSKIVVASIAIMATVVLAGYGVMHFKGNGPHNTSKNISECESINNEMIKELKVPEGYGLYTIKVLRTDITQKYQEKLEEKTTKLGEEALSVGNKVDIDLINESIDEMICKTYKDISYTSLKDLEIVAVSGLETKNKEKYDRDFITKTVYPNPGNENELESNVEKESKSDNENKKESYECFKEQRYEIYSSIRRNQISHMMDITEEEYPQNKDKQIDVHCNGYEYITLQLKNEDLKKMKENVEKYGEVEYYDYDILRFDDLENFEWLNTITLDIQENHVGFTVLVLEDDVKNYKNLEAGKSKTLVYESKEDDYKKVYKNLKILHISATEKDHSFYYRITFELTEEVANQICYDKKIYSDKLSVFVK